MMVYFSSVVVLFYFLAVVKLLFLYMYSGCLFGLSYLVLIIIRQCYSKRKVCALVA
jgi:hypothetical protein